MSSPLDYQLKSLLISTARALLNRLNVINPPSDFQRRRFVSRTVTISRDKMIKSRFAATAAMGIMINRRDKELVDIPICPGEVSQCLVNDDMDIALHHNSMR